MAVAAPLPRPIRRASAVAGIVAVALLLAGCLTPGQDSVLRELNADRRAYNRSNLPTHAQAQAKALAWAEKTDHQVQAAALGALATFMAAGW